MNRRRGIPGWLVFAGLVGFAGHLRAAQFGDFTYTDDGTSITISDFPTSFAGEVVIPESINGKPVTHIKKYAFVDCSKITSVTLPSSVTHLGYGAFEQCNSLISINIPPSVLSIDYSCFYSCDNLSSVTIPSSATTLGTAIFQRCGALESVNLPSDMTVIPQEMFSECVKLANISIPSTIHTIGKSAFSGCTGLKNLTFPESLITVEDFAFSACGLTSLTLPKNIVNVGSGAFMGCHDLESLGPFPTSAKLSTWAFRDCTGLVSLDLPDSVAAVGSELFSNCTGLKQVIAPRYWFETGNGFFTNCTAIESIEIPADVTLVATAMFQNCTALKRATFLGNAPTVERAIFSGVDPDFSIYYQPGASGFTSPTWSGYPAAPLVPEIEIQAVDAAVLLDDGIPQSLGSVVLGQSASIDFLIRNVGTVSLTGLSVSNAGAQSVEFAIASLQETALEPGGSVPLSVTFTPAALGHRTTVLQIVSNDADENPFAIQLSGNGIPVPVPDIAVEQPAGSHLAEGKSKRSFGTVKVGSSGNSKIFSITNKGKAKLTGLAIQKGGSNPKDFAISTSGKASLASGGVTTFKVTFIPSSGGARSATIAIMSNDPDESPFDIHVAGFGAKDGK